MEIPYNHPIQKYSLPGTISSLLSTELYLFFGLQNGNIVQWKVPGEFQLLKGHSGSVRCMLQCGDVLWSSAGDTIRLWNIHDGQCIQNLDIKGSVSSLALWRGQVIGTNTVYFNTHIWNLDGTPSAQKWMLTFGSTLAVWNDVLCSDTSNNLQYLIRLRTYHRSTDCRRQNAWMRGGYMA
jgi:hypothetical protein